MDEMTEHLLHAIEKLSYDLHSMLSTGVVHDPHTHQLVRDAEEHLLAARKLSKKPADPLATNHPVIFAPPPPPVQVTSDILQSIGRAPFNPPTGFVPPDGQIVVGKPAA